MFLFLSPVYICLCFCLVLHYNANKGLYIYFHSRLYYVYPTRGNSKNGTAGVAAMIATRRGIERSDNGTGGMATLQLQVIECM